MIVYSMLYILFYFIISAGDTIYSRVTFANLNLNSSDKSCLTWPFNESRPLPLPVGSGAEYVAV